MSLALESCSKSPSLSGGVAVGVSTMGVLVLLPLGGILRLVIGAVSSLPAGLELLAEDNIVSLYYSVLTQQGLNKSY